ncbi:MAG: alanine racemase [Saprospirales bacterium]|nr:MAG: alanine racemase [Saprospirales bacterium]
MVRHSSRIELSQKALTSNINFVRKKVGRNVRISSVVKANAYGHGIDPFVRMAEKAGINHFSVASAHEANEALQCKSKSSSIMIMGILYEEDIEWAVENGIEFYVFNYDRLLKVLETAKKCNKPALIHLEVETGANRTGLPMSEFTKSLSFIKKYGHYLKYIGLCSHLGGAESDSNKFKIDIQQKRFTDYIKISKSRKMNPEVLHLASSAAALAYPETRFNMVRAGVIQYGFWPGPDIYYHHLNEVNKTSDRVLKRIITWKTDIMDIRDVPRGEFVGYGTAFQAQRDMRIAVMPLGYSNGYPRAQSNRGHVLIHGKKAPITGLINMNLFMVDVSHIPEADIGDEVVLVGRQKNSVIRVSSFTESINLLNNEMLSRLPSAIPREIVK